MNCEIRFGRTTSPSPLERKTLGRSALINTEEGDEDSWAQVAARGKSIWRKENKINAPEEIAQVVGVDISTNP